MFSTTLLALLFPILLLFSLFQRHSALLQQQQQQQYRLRTTSTTHYKYNHHYHTNFVSDRTSITTMPPVAALKVDQQSSLFSSNNSDSSTIANNNENEKMVDEHNKEIDTDSELEPTQPYQPPVEEDIEELQHQLEQEHAKEYPTLAETYDQLTDKLLTKFQHWKETTTHSNKQQYWISIAGGPGSGKSTGAQVIANRLNEKLGKDFAIVIPMDGYHIPKDLLLQEYGEENGLKRRGAPWTFDTTKCYQEIKLAKENKSAWFPIYDRGISDPIPHRVELKDTHRIVFVEGLYLLMKDDKEWGKVHDLFDERWFIRCKTREQQIDRLVQRMKATWTKDKQELWGPWPQGARKKVEANDVKNMDFLEYCELNADEVIISH